MAANEAAPAAGGGTTAKPVIPPGKAITLLSAQCAVFCALGFMLWHWSGRTASGFVRFSLAEGLAGLGMGFVLIALAAALFYGLPKMSGRLVRMQSDTYAFLGPDLGWPAIVFISVCAGAGEEALLRGGIQTMLSDHVGPVAAILVASAAFAALHLAKPVVTVLLLGIGLVFGVIYWLTGSLLTVTIGHTLYDIWALRYLNREMHRLGLFEPAPALAKASDPG